MDLAIDAAWAAGLILSILRVTAFMLASPLFLQAIPMVGRLALALSLGLFLSAPLAGDLSLGRLMGAAAINVIIGLVLGLMTAFVFAMFPIAGGIVDMNSGLAAASLIDPAMNVQASVFNRLFTFTALTMFLALQGHHLLVHGLSLSVETIPLDGSIQFDDSLLEWVIMASERMIIAGAELALPAVGALFLAEVTLGLASRFAPQSNVFLLGLPLRILISLVTAGLVVGFFPSAVDGMQRMLREAFVAGLRGMGVGG